jgi:hypothetical protein
VRTPSASSGVASRSGSLSVIPPAFPTLPHDATGFLGTMEV